MDWMRGFRYYRDHELLRVRARRKQLTLGLCGDSMATALVVHATYGSFSPDDGAAHSNDGRIKNGVIVRRITVRSTGISTSGDAQRYLAIGQTWQMTVDKSGLLRQTGIYVKR
jgi:hypothetical protein